MGDIDKLPPLESFLETLNLVDTGARTSNDIFTGKSQWMPHGRVFGGQVSAQSIMAASLTVDEDRPMHSMHGYFLRPGDVRFPITFAVDRIHDGRSFSTRSVRAFQHGQQIWSMIASFQVEEDGLTHAAEMPGRIPDPESLESEASQVAVAGESLANYWVHRRPFAMRHVDGALYLRPADRREAREMVWVKAQGQLPDDPAVHRAALCYVSDYLMLDPILRRHGLAWIDRRIRVASLDHGLRWHRFARADEWLLLVLDSPAAQNGRGLTNGQFFDRQGRLVASVSQEAMIRLKE
ncbi:acyl-CoA thioesterase [Gulosibacter molinativorax]|uniref:Acyl-CoA thioesterase II n=1 Tax=Gulosibacter molinativorax TaxID=256821 RepID=A0ABT7C9K6_9MICO|nr:acyl-CoA thioesterase II [Gulosibacter molinativorax]MDJ1371845.1 acyl-CoA thioesterase II [Gulosibacter molinativorax]